MKFSIIVPVYNVENELKRCIQSLQNQSYQNYEVILVDDGSTDGSGKLCDKFGKEDSKIIVVHKENGGLSSARNKGMEYANGEYLIFLDSDDYIEADYCDVISRIVKKTNADIVAVEMLFERNGKIEEKRINSIKPYCEIDSKNFLLTTLKSASFNAEACGNVYKREFWKDNGFKFADVYHEDLEIALKVFLEAKTIVYCPDAKYHAVSRIGSIMNDGEKAEKRQKDLLYILQEWIGIADNVNNRGLCRAIKGTASRTYIYSCAHNEIKNPGYTVVKKIDIVKYALNVSDLIKGILFIISPEAYSKAWKKKHFYQ